MGEGVDLSAVWGPAAIAGYILIVLGLIGSVVPLLPGPMVIWMGILMWAWGDAFERIGWGLLTLLLLLALVAWASDFLINMLVSRKAGASWAAIFASIAGGIVGGLALNGVIPILGSLLGAAIGAIGGMFAVEYWRTREWRKAGVAVRSYLGSMVIASMIEIAIAVTMVGLFAWRAFL
jgi:uncharacterized protein YqgC (DUF456 family)